MPSLSPVDSGLESRRRDSTIDGSLPMTLTRFFQPCSRRARECGRGLDWRRAEHGCQEKWQGPSETRPEEASHAGQDSASQAVTQLSQSFVFSDCGHEILAKTGSLEESRW